MKTSIETTNLIATYEDSRKMRDELFEHIISVFTENNFSSLDIIESGADDDLIVALERIIDFDVKYKENE